MTPNMAGFLTMLSHSEGTDRAADSYRVCYAFHHTIVDLRDHPSVTGEWKGESLASLGPQYAHSISTAAGRYQLIKPTWLDCKAALHLPDFTAPSQDDAAIYLIKQKGALDLVNSGRVAEAINLCHGVWASLPGSTSGQPQTSFAALMNAYSAAGGAFV